MFLSFCICQFFAPVHGSAETQAVRPSHASLVPSFNSEQLRAAQMEQWYRKSNGEISAQKPRGVPPADYAAKFKADYASGKISAQKPRGVPPADYTAWNALMDRKLNAFLDRYLRMSLPCQDFPLSDAELRSAVLTTLGAKQLSESYMQYCMCLFKCSKLPDVDLRLALLAQLEIFANQQVPESSVQDYIRRFTEWAESIKDLGEKQLPEWKGKREGLAWRPAVPHTQQKMPGYFSRFYAWWKKPEEQQAAESSAPDQNPCYFITGATPPTPNEQRVIADLALLTLVVQTEHARAQKDYAQFEALLGTVRQYLKERPRAATMGMLRPWVEALQQQKDLRSPTLTEVEERIRFPQVDAIKQNTLSAIKATGYAAGGIVLTCVLAYHQASIYEYLYTIALSAWGAGSTPMMPPQVPAPPPPLPPALSPAGHLRRHLATEAVDVLGLATSAMQNSSAALLALVAASGSTPCEQRALWLRNIFGHVDTQSTWVRCIMSLCAGAKVVCQALLTGTDQYALAFSQCVPSLSGVQVGDGTAEIVFSPDGGIIFRPGLPCRVNASTTPMPTTPALTTPIPTTPTPAPTTQPPTTPVPTTQQPTTPAPVPTTPIPTTPVSSTLMPTPAPTTPIPTTPAPTTQQPTTPAPTTPIPTTPTLAPSTLMPTPAPTNASIPVGNCTRYDWEVANNPDARSLLNGIPCNATLLRLGSPTMTPAQFMGAMPALLQMMNLTNFNLNGAVLIGAAEIIAAIPVIKQQAQLQKLEFGNTLIGDTGANTLAPILPSLINIYRLSFYQTAITETGALAMLKYLQQMPKLIVLFFTGLNFNTTTQKTITDALPGATVSF